MDQERESMPHERKSGGRSGGTPGGMGRPTWRTVLVAFLVTRGGLLCAGLLGSRLLSPGLNVQSGNLVYHQPAPPWLDIWVRWDAEWYLLIAADGYDVGRQLAHLPGNLSALDASGFFPLYPLAIRAISGLGLSPVAAALLIANLALLGALGLLHALVRLDFGQRVAARTVWLILCFPTSLFLSAAYAESLMLCLALAALTMARHRRPWLAGLFAGLCALSRPAGFLIVLPLLGELIPQDDPPAGTPPTGGLRQRLGLITATLGPTIVALAGFAFHCRAVTGEPLAFILRQEKWRGVASGPWRAFLRYFENPTLHGAHHSSIDLIVAAGLVVSIPFLFHRLPRSYALYGTALILLPLGTTLWSFSRFAAIIFPFQILLALTLARSDRGFAAWLGGALPASAACMALYASWWWVG